MNDPRSQRPITRDEWRAMWIVLALTLAGFTVIIFAIIGFKSVFQ